MTDNERREMEQMRKEAERRVRDMNARAKAAVSGSENKIPIKTNEQPKQELKVQPQNRGLGLLKMLNLQSLKLDNDILVIIMMIMLLGNDDADELLLLALVYIMW